MRESVAKRDARRCRFHGEWFGGVFTKMWNGLRGHRLRHSTPSTRVVAASVDATAKIICGLNRRPRIFPGTLRTPARNHSQIQKCQAVFFGALPAYFRLKRSMRPAVSSSFCLPVKNGWQFEQISTRNIAPFIVDLV